MNALLYFSFLIKWKKKDDDLLRFAILKYGKSSWFKITNVFFFHKKTTVNCRFRWFNWLVSEIKKTNWTNKEDKKLILLKKKNFFGYWRFLVFFLKRTPVQCLFRFLILNKIFTKFFLIDDKNIWSKNIIPLKKVKFKQELKRNQILQFRKELKKKTSLKRFGNFFMGRIRGMNWLGKKQLRLRLYKKLHPVRPSFFSHFYPNLNIENKKNKTKKNPFFFFLLLMLDLNKRKKKILKKYYLEYLKVSSFFFFQESHF